MSVLSLFPARVQIADANGFATPEFLRALAVVFDRIGGSLGDVGADVFAPIVPENADTPEFCQLAALEKLYPDVVQPQSQGTVYFTDVMQPATPDSTVGQFISSTVATGSAVSLTTNTPANVTSISLTAGDWDVWLTAYFQGGATTQVFGLIASISQTSATVDPTAGSFGICYEAGDTTFTGVPQLSVPAGATRLNLTTTTTVYLVVQAGFLVSTCAAYGTIMARRRK